MSGKYTAKAANAAKAISKAGALLPFRRFAKVFDAVTGGTTNGTILVQSLPALVLPVGKDDSLPEGLVVANARKLLVAGYGATFSSSQTTSQNFQDCIGKSKALSLCSLMHKMQFCSPLLLKKQIFQRKTKPRLRDEFLCKNWPMVQELASKG